MPGHDQSDSAPRAARFASAATLPDPLPTDPFPLFVSWFEEAHSKRVQPNPNAFTLATVDPDGTPSARIVLCKAIDPKDGRITFFTNYDGRKGRALAADARAAACFFWDDLDRQVRIEGPVLRSPPAESDAYFASRAWESRIGAWASNQSQPIASRDQLMQQALDAMVRFGIDPVNPPDPSQAAAIPRPPHWGGYRLWAQRLELWTSGPGRIHDRALWTRPLQPTTSEPGFLSGFWTASRLQP
jgi:pyridoxamine 5'-phosphate oxidase